MCKVFIQGHDYVYEVEDILKNFCNSKEMEFVDKRVLADCQGLFVESSLEVKWGKIIIKCTITNGTKKVEETSSFNRVKGDDLEKRKHYKRMVKHNMLTAAEKFFNRSLPWGILSGIRPVKVVHQLLDEGLSREYIRNEFIDFYRLAQHKADLIIDIANRERKYILPYDAKKVSVYISIPFCPTRCSYCSFPSNEMRRWGHLVDEYLNSLIKEMEAVHYELNNIGYHCQTVYVGGGTPTSLNYAQMNLLLRKIREYFISDDTLEFTVEAGRPDTLDREKLRLIKGMGVTRIGINPQSMNAVTLKKIGRNHTPQEVVRAFELARSTGHNNVNMDVIMGLPGEDPDMVRNTMESICRLKPEGVTIHTLAIKRASRLKEEISGVESVEEKEVKKMLDLAIRYVGEIGMYPYYLYRQKYMIGNLENVGYSLPGFEGIYNMQIMEEKQTIIGLGAGAVSKLVFLEEDRLERVANIKDLHYYITRLDEVIKRKISGINTLVNG